jgi:hypothetical protein
MYRALDHSSLPIAAAALAAALFMITNFYGWTVLQFGDEAGHLLVALALHAGDRLYASYVDAHGPLVFMLTQFYGAVTGWGDLSYARIIPTIFALLAAIALIRSPVIANLTDRCAASALFLGILSSVWFVQLLYLDNYHALGGCLVVIVIATFVAPCWHRLPVSRLASATAGLSLAMTAMPLIVISQHVSCFLEARLPRHPHARDRPSPGAALGWPQGLSSS